MSVARKICAFTSTRADYGLLCWTLHGLAADPMVELQILCSGTHLCSEYGLTVKDIEKDGLPIAARCEIVLASDSSLATAKSMSLAISDYASTLTRLNPDLILLLGDRYEALALAIAATLCRFPLAHCHGGEVTAGALDESFRHSISKMSHLHFCSTRRSAQRLQQLGENSDRIFQVGGLGVENINKLQLWNKAQLSSDLGLDFSKGVFLTTYHPATLDEKSSHELFGNLLEALDQFPKHSVLFTLPNADQDGRVIIQLIQEYVKANPARTLAVPSLGQLRYLSAMKHCLAVVGNSSSGILEAPSLRRPTVNIGERQAGRERADTVIDCASDPQSIVTALQSATSAGFQENTSHSTSPYGHGNASERIIPVLRDFPLHGLLEKHFRDIDPK